MVFQELNESDVLKDMKFDVIVWNFPCQADEKGADAQLELFELNRVNHTFIVP